MDAVVDREALDGRALEARHAGARTEIGIEAETTLTGEIGATGMGAIESTIWRTANENESESAGTRRGGAAPAPSATGGRRRLQKSTTLSSKELRGTPAWATA